MVKFFSGGLGDRVTFFVLLSCTTLNDDAERIEEFTIVYTSIKKFDTKIKAHKHRKVYAMMYNVKMKNLLVFVVFALPVFVFAHGGEVKITPTTVFQGEPFMAIVEGVDIRDIKKFSFAGKTISLFIYNKKPTALVGVDLTARVGNHTLSAQTLDGDVIKKEVTVKARKKESAPLGIPEKLGGNTKTSQNKLVSNLSKENVILSRVKVTASAFWKKPFMFPLASTTVTDGYGYSRKTGSYSIPHKGTDFRAPLGTTVTAINDGVVRLARDFTVYGKTVAIDHGGGVMSFSMHLSKLAVKEGQKVARGQKIGASGESGYSLTPHLHLSIRLHGISIDHMKFFALFNVRV